MQAPDFLTLSKVGVVKEAGYVDKAGASVIIVPPSPPSTSGASDAVVIVAIIMSGLVCITAMVTVVICKTSTGMRPELANHGGATELFDEGITVAESLPPDYPPNYHHVPAGQPPPWEGHIVQGIVPGSPPPWDAGSADDLNLSKA